MRTPSRWAASCAIIGARHMQLRTTSTKSSRSGDNPSADAVHPRDVGARALHVGPRVGHREVAGYRNAQTTCIAPTGTIGLVMDCDTTGIEPDFALVKFKKLAGGGYFKIVNSRSSRPCAASATTPSRSLLSKRLPRHEHPRRHADINRATLKAKASMTKRRQDRIPASGAFEIGFVFNQHVLGEEFCREKLGMTDAQLADWNHSILRDTLGFTSSQIEEASDVICGRMTLEGAPFLNPEHLPVFDCATPCGKHGARFIRPLAHVDMMARRSRSSAADQ